MRALALLLLLALPAAALEPDAVELPRLRTEYNATYRLPSGTMVVSSSGQPEHWWDTRTQRWRKPVKMWRHGKLDTLPGPLVYEVGQSGLWIKSRETGEPTHALGWWPDEKPAAHRTGKLSFAWRGLPCALSTLAHGLKLACTVEKPLGERTLRVAAIGEWAIDAGAAIGGQFKMDRLTIIGADGIEYPTAVSDWSIYPVVDGGGALSVTVDDSALPPEAYPYVLDPVAGANYPTACTQENGPGTINWTNPSNAQTDNNADATASITAGATTEYLNCETFGFADPPFSSAAVIRGIVVEARVEQSGTNINITDIRLVKGGTIGATNRAVGACASNWSGAESTRSCGSSTDLWGTTWTPAEITNSGFGVAMAARNSHASTTRTASVDALRIFVYYDPSGRVYAGGWDTWGAEGDANSTPVVSTAGGLSYPAGAARTGNAGLRLTVAANTATNWCVELDEMLANRAYWRVYTVNAAPLDIGETVMLSYARQTSETGCYGLLSRDDDGYAVTMRYHGKEGTDIDFGQFSIVDGNSLAGTAIVMGQAIEGGYVSCPLFVNGYIVQSVAAQMAGDCSDDACDLTHICLGTPAVETVDGYESFPAVTYDLDDFVVDNTNVPSTGIVLPIFPSGPGTTETFSSTGCTAGTGGWDCLIDWETGVEDSCISSPHQRTKATGTGVDLWAMDDITLATGEVVKQVYVRESNCSTTTGTGSMRPYVRVAATNTAFGAALTIAENVKLQQGWSMLSVPHGTDPWTEALVDGMEVGYEKHATGATPRATALLAYIDIETPVPPVDRTLQDWRGNGDGITIIFACDSITSGTAGAACQDEAGACTEACDEDADCDAQAAGQCRDNACVYLCEYNEQCTCGSGATCPTVFKWVNQLTRRLPQASHLMNCGRDTMPLKSWWQEILPDVLANPYSHFEPCELIRGAWGHCSSTGGNCTTDDSCPSYPSESCTPHVPDYIVDICGANDIYQLGIADGGWNVSALVVGFQDRWKQRDLPEAASSPTGYQIQRVECTSHAECSGDGSSLCLGYCEGHQDPVWPCTNTVHCGTCADDNDVACGHFGTCAVNDGSGDCGYRGEWDAGTWGVECPSCETRACLTSTKYCTPRCADLACATDADCSPPGTVGGLCDTVEGVCKMCAFGNHWTGARDADFYTLQARRQARHPAGVTSDQLLAKELGTNAIVDAVGARRVAGTYALTWQQGRDHDLGDLMTRHAAVKLRRLPNVVDNHNAIRYRDDRQIYPFGHINWDGVHTYFPGATALGEFFAATLNSMYPVCSTDTSKPCAFCDIPCTTDVQCNKPVVGASPTPTPKAGACRTATPAVNVCGCTVDADCATGLVCLDIDSGAGTDKRCVTHTMDKCPAGNGLDPGRATTANDYVCSQQGAGTCDAERSRPRCTNFQTEECTTTADCDGLAKGDLCAADAVFLSCERDQDCRDGGYFPDDVCAPGTPVGATTPTPKSRYCQQPTPTPTP